MSIAQEQTQHLIALLRKRFPDWSGFDHPGFQKDEIDYKQAAAEKAATLLSQDDHRRLLDENNADEIISRLETIGRATNLLWLNVPKDGDLNILYQDDLDKLAFCQQVFDLLYGAGSTPDRLGRYVAYVKAQKLPNKWTFPTYLLFLCHPDSEIFVKPEVTRQFLKSLEGPFKLGTPSAETYARFRQFAHDLKKTLAAYGPRDMIDIQSLIWVCGREASSEATLAEPFSNIFSDRKEAEWAFDLLQETLERLAVSESDNPPIALTLPHKGKVLRLNYGRWVVLGFCGPNAYHHGIEMALLPAVEGLESDVGSWDPFKQYNDEQIKVYTLPTPVVRAWEGSLRAIYETTFDRLREKFGHWRGSSFSPFHQSRVYDAVFDPDKRAELLTEGLTLSRADVPAQTFEEAIASFNRDDYADELRAAEEERQAILERFPLDAWPTLALERYALGQDDSTDTYCYWLEFGAPHLGSIRGGSSLKHLIFKRKSKPGWYFPKEYDDKETAWSAIRAGFVHAFDLAKQGQWDEIDSIPSLQGARALRTKSLHIYFRDEILPINTDDHIVHFLQRLDAFDKDLKSAEILVRNRTLLSLLRGYPRLADWSTNELASLLYAWAHPRESKNIIKIAPGENARYWKECLEGDYICVGWDDVGDLRQYESKQAFREQFGALYFDTYKGHRSTITRKANEVWTLMQLEPGDIVVANQGTTKVLALGEVVEPGYEWRPERPEYKHTVRVHWDTSYAQTVPQQKPWATTTVRPISASLYQRILSRSDPAVVPPIRIAVDPSYREAADALHRKGQLIFYGPPGTGKTYFTRRFATWWLLDHRDKDTASIVLVDDEKLNAAEQQLTVGQSGRRFWWVVAHPGEWTWDQLFTKGNEPFRQGRLKRNYSKLAPGDLVFGYRSGSNRGLVALARVTKALHEMQGEWGFEVEGVRQIQGPTYADLKEDPVISVSEPMRHTCQGTLFALAEREASHLLRMIEANDPDFDVSELYGEGVGQLTWTTFHPSYAYEDFVEGFRPVDSGAEGLSLKLENGLFKRICQEALVHPEQPYLLIIDEINRANIAKVFGELITLLERDKRGLPIVLPQSKERFVVPPNVYLVGTMNTADRSIRLLDAALRRRFAFIEQMPDPSLLEGTIVDGLNLDGFLETLNQRISAREGREKQIGHAFLMDDGSPITQASAFCVRFRQEILPLLQEYCYDDYGILSTYIGEDLVDQERQRLKDEILSDDDALIAALIEAMSKDEQDAVESRQ